MNNLALVLDLYKKENIISTIMFSIKFFLGSKQYSYIDSEINRIKPSDYELAVNMAIVTTCNPYREKLPSFDSFLDKLEAYIIFLNKDPKKLLEGIHKNYPYPTETFNGENVDG